MLYYRAVDQFAVDVVIENSPGLLVGVEVNATATATASVSERDLRGLKKLASVAGPQFKMGVVLYDGTETLPLGNGMWVAPPVEPVGPLTSLTALKFLPTRQRPA